MFVEYNSESWQKKSQLSGNILSLLSLVLKYFTCICPFNNLCYKWVSCLRDDEGRIDLNPPGKWRLLEVNYNLIFVAIQMGLYNLNDHRCQFLYNLWLQLCPNLIGLIFQLIMCYRNFSLFFWTVSAVSLKMDRRFWWKENQPFIMSTFRKFVTVRPGYLLL